MPSVVEKDALDDAAGSTSGSERSATVELVAARDGFGWAEALGSAGGAVALIVFGSAATLLIRRRHSPVAP